MSCDCNPSFTGDCMRTCHIHDGGVVAQHILGSAKLPDLVEQDAIKSRERDLSEFDYAGLMAKQWAKPHQYDFSPLHNHEPAPPKRRHQPPHWTDTLAWIGFGLICVGAVGCFVLMIVRAIESGRVIWN